MLRTVRANSDIDSNLCFYLMGSQLPIVRDKFTAAFKKLQQLQQGWEDVKEKSMDAATSYVNNKVKGEYLSNPSWWGVFSKDEMVQKLTKMKHETLLVREYAKIKNFVVEMVAFK